MNSAIPYDPEDYGPFFGSDDGTILGQWGAQLRTSGKSDRELIAEVVASIIYAVLEHGLAMSEVQVGNCAARILHEQAGFHRRPNC